MALGSYHFSYHLNQSSVLFIVSQSVACAFRRVGELTFAPRSLAACPSRPPPIPPRHPQPHLAFQPCNTPYPHITCPHPATHILLLRSTSLNAP